MKTINDTDTIYATILQYGKISKSVKLCGMSSMNAIITYLRSHNIMPTGLSQLSIRNCSQGWNAMQSLYIR